MNPNAPNAGGLVVQLLFYLYFAFCLHTINKKTIGEKVWMAWVPIANIWLMSKIAGDAKKWFFMFLGLLVLTFLSGVLAAALPFLLFLTAILYIVFFGILWVKIAKKRNKPAWWGIIAILPILSIFGMGYLAFSGDASVPSSSAQE